MTRTDAAVPVCRAREGESVKLAEWCEHVIRDAATPFDAACRLVRRLGAHLVEDRAEIGFWAPELAEKRIGLEDAFLEVLHPVEPLTLGTGRQQVTFRRQRLPLVRHEEFAWAVVDGMIAGTRETVGSFYQLRYRDRQDVWHTIPDYVAHSVPFGAFAPAEFYDIARLDRERADRAYFETLTGAIGRDGVPRLNAPTNILQIHVPTASSGGTLASLARIYAVIADKLRAGHALLPEEEPYVGYDAVQLLPVEPTIEYEAGPRFWEAIEGDDPEADHVTVDLRRPDMSNWGYDVVISASSAVNPVLLETGRPDELVDLAVVLHTFPERPIRLIFDVVFGHADNQAVDLINRHFFTGPNMYGQDLQYRNPVVRALMLEMQRRKVNFGADGVRVDGAQDFKWWDAETHALRHDDEYLTAMSDVVQEVAGRKYRPWMIFEDGRPWPEEDWELSSTYRAVIEEQPHVFQWGPLTFAHNTPFLYTFWISKWWRIEEMVRFGENWITGCANHDTLRRGTQIDPRVRINKRLGRTLLEILDNAYDNAAANMLTYACLPGVPMDFINASMRASWGFVRNTDDRYGVKVVSEEAGFLDWQVDEIHYNRPGNFNRLKGLGFDDLEELRRFMRILSTSVIITNYDLDAIVKLLQAVDPPLAGPHDLSVPVLKEIARAWMDDLFEYCNVSYYKNDLNPAQTRFNMELREFRRSRPWLRNALGAGEHFGCNRPVRGSVVFHGLRRSPDGRELILFIANMEGGPMKVRPTALPIPNLPEDSWRVALATPGLQNADPIGGVEIDDSEALLLVRRAG